MLEPHRCKCNNYTPANFFRFCLSSVDCLPATLQEKDQKTEAKIKDWLINAQSYSVVTAAIIVIYDDMYLYMYICIMYYVLVLNKVRQRPIWDGFVGLGANHSCI